MSGRRVSLVFLALACFASRLAFLPSTLEDIDSVNFALALEEFDPTRHQPHAPGYPLFVGATRALHLVFDDPVLSLSLVSALAQAALVYPLYALFLALSSREEVALFAVGLTLCCPVLWLAGVRPMSDSFGLLMTVAALALLVAGGEGSRHFVLGSFVAGLAPGARLQSVLLTGPIFLHAFWRTSGARLRALGATAAGTLFWIVPVVVASGGAAAYLRTFAETFSEAADSEPLLRDPSLNRVARSLVAVLLRPWGSEILGAFVLALAAVGALTLLRSRRRALFLGAAAFVPYLVVHLFLQHVETVRYSLPYVPFLSWLAAEGTVGVAAAATASTRWLGRTALALGTAGSLAVALPALLQYSREPSPVDAAFDEIGRVALPPSRYVLAGHHTFARYYGLRPQGLALLEARPRAEVTALRDYWLSGGEKRILFLADPGRTDLAAIAPEGQASLGLWERPSSLSTLLSGTRPGNVELLELSPPRWFVGSGWLLSLESGRVSELGSYVEREAFLRAGDDTTFLLVAGEPAGPCPGVSLELAVQAEVLVRKPCAEPLLLGLSLPAVRGGGFTRLVIRSKRKDEPIAAAFALTGLDYGPDSLPGLVCGPGLFHPEPDEEKKRFRWASTEVLCLAHVPEGGAALVVEGVAPLEYLGPGVGVEVHVGAGEPQRAVLDERPFRLEAPLAPGSPFVGVTLRTDRSFVPDDLQKNGDRRVLSLRIYSMRVEGAGSKR